MRSIHAIALAACAILPAASAAHGGELHASPPPPGPTTPPSPIRKVGPSFAVRRFHLGEANPDGTLSSTAWRHYGYDLDGKSSTKDSRDLCKPSQGAKESAVYPDGPGGIDNSFGKNLVPILASLVPRPSEAVTRAIASGAPTLLIDIPTVPGVVGSLGGGSPGVVPDVNPLGAQLYLGAQQPAAPRFDGTDSWLVNPASVRTPGQLSPSRFAFPTSYVVNGTWVSGAKASMALALEFAGVSLHLTLESVLVSLDLSTQKGMIAGILDTEQFVTELAKVAGSFDPTLCPPSVTFESIAQQVRQASDILTDGSQDPTKTCNGISFGIGFETVRAKVGGIGAAMTPAASTCPTP